MTLVEAIRFATSDWVREGDIDHMGITVYHKEKYSISASQSRPDAVLVRVNWIGSDGVSNGMSQIVDRLPRCAELFRSMAGITRHEAPDNLTNTLEYIAQLLEGP
jgi:hypothetical protein